MRTVLDLLHRRTEEFAREPFFAFVCDASIDPRRRFWFAPSAAHFVMTFADLYALVFRREPAQDEVQQIVNAHTYEDGGHWRWFLADLGTIGHDPSMAFSDALAFVWNDATTRVRMLSYEMCHLGIGADPLRKLVLVLCIEATGMVSLRHLARLAAEWSAITGKRLHYFGSHHLDTENEHTLEDDDVRRKVGEIWLEPDVSRQLSSLVDHVFTLFTALVRDLHAVATDGRRIGAASNP